MATVGALTIDLQAQTAAFIADMGKATRALQTNTAQMNRSLKTLQSGFSGMQAAVGKLVGVLGVGLGVEALASGLKRALDTAGGLGELAEQLGVSTDALQVYQYAAGQAGASNEELKGGIARLTKTIGDAASGNKKAIESFEELGVKILDANGNIRSTDDVLRDVSNALAAVEDPARRAAAIVDLMGRNGQKLLPVFGQGADALARFEAQARSAGMVISKDGINIADQASDAWKRMEDSSQKLAQTLAVKLAPAFQKVADAMRIAFGGESADEAITRLQSRIADLQKLRSASFDPTVKRDIKRLQDELRAVQSDVNDQLQGAEMRAAAQAGAGVSNPTPMTTLKDDAPAKAAENARKQLDQYVASLQAEQTQLTMTARAREISENLYKAEAIARAGGLADIEAEKQMIEELTGAIYDHAEAVKEDERRRQALMASEEAYLRVQSEIADNATLIEALRKSTEEYQKQAAYLEILNRQKATGVEIDDQIRESAREQADVLGAQREEMDKLKDAHESYKRAAVDATHVIGTAFEDAVIDMRSWRDVAIGALKDFERMLLRLSVTAPLQSWAEGLFKGGVGTRSDGTGAGSNGFGVLSLVGSMMGGMFAGGGRPPSDVPSIVGEQGPEVFVPDVAGTVVPNHMLGGDGPTFNANITVNTQGGGAADPAQGRNLGAAITRQLDQWWSQKMADAMRPGNQLNPTF